MEWIKERLGVKMGFPMITDDTGAVASKLGLIHPDKDTNMVRAVFMIDPEGVIRAIIYYLQELGRNMDEYSEPSRR